MTHDQSRRHSRRTFLKTAAFTSSVLAVPALIPAAQASAAAPVAKLALALRARVGILLPQVSQYPALSQNFLNGLSLAFGGPQREGAISLETNVVAAGAQQSQIETALGDLLSRQSPDLVLGIMRPEVSAGIRALLAKQGRTLVTTGLSATVPEALKSSPWVIDYSLPYWQSSWALGFWAAQNVGKRAAILHSFFESGYDASFAFSSGFQAGGGAITSMTVTHAPKAALELARTLATVAAEAPDVVYLGYTGTLAGEMLRAYGQSDLRKLPLLGAGTLVEGAALSQLGSAALGMRTAMPWNLDGTQTSSKNFVSAYRQATRTNPDHWALLGFETGGLLSAATQALKGDWRDPAAVQAALLASQTAGPRGLTGPQVTGADTAFVIREVRQSRSGFYNATLATVNAAPLADQQIAAMQSGLRSGCSLPYLTV
jgi:branched-chain amino acid transport system substrate-binding protein